MNSRQMVLQVTTGFMAFTVLACQGQSRPLAPKPVEIAEQTASAEPVKIDIQREVDILFVIDDSGSMKSHQARLAAAIDKFVDGFAKSAIVDFQIGILSIWDPIRYGDYDFKTARIARPGIVPYLSRSGQPQFDLPGRLRPLKAPVGQEELLKNQPKNFVRNQPGYVEVLKESLKIGVRAFERFNSPEKDASGPEFEDLFTPVKAALTDPVRGKDNAGFYRPKAHLVVVPITDANDASPLSASELHRFLVELKGGKEQSVSVFPIVIGASDASKDCVPDPAGRPLKLEQLASLAKGKILSLCRDYAKDLAEIGTWVRDRTVGEIRLSLGAIPELGSIKVSYGGQEIPYSQSQGWAYDEDDKALILRGAGSWANLPGEPISVTFLPVNPARPNTTCVGRCVGP